jgi:hypothetical protein
VDYRVEGYSGRADDTEPDLELSELWQGVPRGVREARGASSAAKAWVQILQSLDVDGKPVLVFRQSSERDPAR